MSHIVAFPRWQQLTLRISQGSELKTCFDFYENSVKLIMLGVAVSSSADKVGKAGEIQLSVGLLLTKPKKDHEEERG